MSVITKILKQTCIYWASLGVDDYGNISGFDAPIELDCRWEDFSEEIINSFNTKILSKTRVFVSEDIVVGGVLMLGTLDDILYENPLDNEGAYEILKFEKIPNFKCTEYLRKAYL